MTAEGPLQFVDTNVLVYAHDVTAGEKQRQARAVLHALWETGNGCLSVQVLQEFFVTLTRKVPRPVTTEGARKLVADLSTWRIHAAQAEDVLGAIDLQQRHALSFWDAMILHSAVQLGSPIVLSEDLSPDRSYDGVQVVNPFAPQA